MPSYPWYQAVEGTEVQQGDILENFPFATPRENDPAHVEVLSRDVIIMTPSCDILHDRVSHLIFCPIYQLEEYSSQDSRMKKKEVRDEIRKGRVVHMHLLNRCDLENFQRDYWIVNLIRILEASKDNRSNFTSQCGERLRLLPPYREHLSQAFARYFMRVGLPSDISPFK